VLPDIKPYIDTESDIYEEISEGEDMPYDE